MAAAESGASNQGMATLVSSNSQKITGQYKSQSSSLLAQRNAIKHKKVDVEDGMFSLPAPYSRGLRLRIRMRVLTASKSPSQ
jgi:hypothetical protein